MSVLNLTITNVGLPTFARVFDVDAAAAIWVTNGFQVPLTMGLLAGAALGRIVGLARLYRMGVLAFLAGTLASAFAPNFAFLVAGRALEGLGSAGIMSVGPALVRGIFPTRMLGQALGFNALVIALAAASGPSLGGLVLAVLPWRWLFLISIPFGLYSLVAGRMALGHTPPAGGRFDAFGAAASAIGIGLLVVSLDGLAHHGRPALVLAGVLVAFATLAAFVRHERRTTEPLLPPAIFASVRFSLATLTSFASFFAASIAIVALPFFFQSGMGLSALQSGLAFAAWPVATALAAPLSGRLADKIPAASIATAGLALFTLGLGLLAGITPHARMPDILWREALCGLGFGIYQSPNNREIMTALGREHGASASVMLAMARVMGQTFGSAAVAIVFGIAGARLAEATQVGPRDLAALASALALACAASAVACAVSATRLRAPRSPAPEVRTMAR